MPQSSIAIPEWLDFLRYYSSKCESTTGQARALEVTPSEDLPVAEHLLHETSECLRLLELETLRSLGSLPDLEQTLMRVQKALILDGQELQNVNRLLNLAETYSSLFKKERTRVVAPEMCRQCNVLDGYPALQRSISDCIDENGGVRDSASSELQGLRMKERKLHSDCRELLESLVAKNFRDGYLQEQYYDYRSGRYAVPVKSEHRNKVPGLQIESSGSKSTVFIEPAAVREANEKLKQVQMDIEEEVYRILSHLSSLLHPKGSSLTQNFEALVHLDLTLGRARIAASFGAFLGSSRPRFSERFHLEAFYHPLLSLTLNKGAIVRNDFQLGPERRTLVVSGPNTGGKTVTIKTLALFSVMARCGFYLTCDGEAELPFFTVVVCQIGDQQDISQSLSSFSGSLLQLKEILSQTREGTLVIVDEILHSTDPDEAAALGRAILEDFAQKGAYSIVTTHLNGLRTSNDPIIQSASMEFDPTSLKPTYRLRLGVPGSSRALEIASTIGFEKSILENAKRFLSAEKVLFQAKLDEAESLKIALQQQQIEMEATLVEIQKKQVAAREQEIFLAEERARFKRESKDLVSRLKAESLRKLNASLEEVRRLAVSIEEKHQVSEAAKVIAQEVSDESTTSSALAEVEKVGAAPEPLSAQISLNPEPVSQPLAQNCTVFVKSKEVHGVLLSDPKSNSPEALVQAGIFKLRVPWGDLVRVAQKGTASYSNYQPMNESAVPGRLNLIGKTAEEAEPVLISFLDQAARTNTPIVTIVHGHGAGILKKLVRTILQKSEYETKFRPGQPNEGGDGCTVVEFL